jgi:hypothetical protein
MVRAGSRALGASGAGTAMPRSRADARGNQYELATLQLRTEELTGVFCWVRPLKGEPRCSVYRARCDLHKVISTIGDWSFLPSHDSIAISNDPTDNLPASNSTASIIGRLESSVVVRGHHLRFPSLFRGNGRSREMGVYIFIKTN